MKLYLKFQLENNIIPCDYRKLFISFQKKSISNINDGKYFDKYFSGNVRKPYTFAVGLTKPKFNKEFIELEKNEISFTFSTGDTLTGYIFYSAFIAMKNEKFWIKNNSMKLVSIRKLQDQSVKSDTAFVKTLSPLCLREHSDKADKYYSVANEDFEVVSKSIISKQLKNEEFKQSLIESVSIIPINARKTVIQHYNNYIEVSIGEFLIKGDKSVINYFLKSGIGSRKSAGFGCLQLISE